jgi:ribosomal protein L7/L12
MRKPFSVLLRDVGRDRASVVASFCGTGLSLSEVEELLSQVPTCFVECDEEEARAWAAELTALGAYVTIGPTAPWYFRETAGPANHGHYDVVLMASGPSTLDTISAVRDVADCSLRDASLIIERAPSYLLRSASIEEAHRAQQRLTAVGAEVELLIDT